jgi:hypothetical protein
MMIPHHHPTHWIGVAVVIALALLAFEAAGQSTNAAAVFEGRPAMAGAQAGQGAQAGLPQGGMGLQGSDGATRSLRKPQVIEQQMAAQPPAACADVPTTSATEKPLCLPQVGDERIERRLTVLGINPQQR